MNNCQSTVAGKQRGVALITVLLVFALAALIASEVVSRNYRDIRRTANAISTKQAYYYALAGEQFARQILYRDFADRDNANIDSLTEAWAQTFDTFEIENGKMSIDIIDLQSRFNLNNVASDPAQASVEFRELLRILNVDTDYTALLQDWLDEDSSALAQGGEDDRYQSGPNAYLAANREMADRSELRLLARMNALDYAALKDYVVALPAPTHYNLNTLDAKIVQALSAQIDSAKARDIEQRQQAGGYRSVNQWLAVNSAQSLAPVRSRLAVESEYFEVVVKTVYDQRTSVVRTQLYRDKKNGEIRVLKRQQGFE